MLVSVPAERAVHRGQPLRLDAGRRRPALPGRPACRRRALPGPALPAGMKLTVWVRPTSPAGQSMFAPGMPR